MAWVPIAESGLAFTFDSLNVDMFGSEIATGGEANPTGFTLGLTDSQARIRLVYSDYTSFNNFNDSGAVAPRVVFTTPSGNVTVVNTSPPNTGGEVPVITGFLPNPVDSESAATLLEYIPWTFSGSSADESFSLVVEVFVDGPEPPPEPVERGTPYRIRNQFRHCMGTDSGFTAWVRDEAGKFDMEGLTLEVSIQRGSNELFKVPAVSTELGRVDFVVTKEQAKKRLDLLSKFRLYVQATYPDETTRTLATGILEVVG